MDQTIIVMIVTLALPSGAETINVKPMPSMTECHAAAKQEAADPYVFDVACSELEDGRLELTFRKPKARKIPRAVIFDSTG